MGERILHCVEPASSKFILNLSKLKENTDLCFSSFFHWQGKKTQFAKNLTKGEDKGKKNRVEGEKDRGSRGRYGGWNTECKKIPALSLLQPGPGAFGYQSCKINTFWRVPAWWRLFLVLFFIKCYIFPWSKAGSPSCCRIGWDIKRPSKKSRLSTFNSLTS